MILVWTHMQFGGSMDASAGRTPVNLQATLAATAVTLGRKAAEIDRPVALLEQRIRTASTLPPAERTQLQAFLRTIRQYQSYLCCVSERLHLEAAECVSDARTPIERRQLHAYCVSVSDQIDAHFGYCRQQLEIWSRGTRTVPPNR